MDNKNEFKEKVSKTPIERTNIYKKLNVDLGRERILQQIENDKKEKKSKCLEKISEEDKLNMTKTTSYHDMPSPTSPNITRIQFRFPDGSNITRQYDTSTKFCDLYQDVKEQIKDKIDEFNLASNFPRRVFENNLENDLKNLDLVPSAVLIIILKERKNHFAKKYSIGIAIFQEWDILSNWIINPIIYVSNIIKSIIVKLTSKLTDNSNINDQVTTSSNHDKPSTSRNYKIENQSLRSRKRNNQNNKDASTSNIVTLKDESENSDDNNTWNGNSTQQM
ncbi:unnamed protein product [Gordionus sp. m RMFG-2023]